MDHNVKISVCIPSRNALNYVRYAIESVLNQEYEDYELLVSDNHSNDGTWDYLKTLSHPKLRIMQPPKMCSMSGHYEWLLTQTKGDWVTIIGADDGMQPDLTRLLRGPFIPCFKNWRNKGLFMGK